MDPWNSLGQHTGVSSLSLLLRIYSTQGSNPRLPHCGWILYQLSHKGSLRILDWLAYPFSRGSSWPRNWTRVFCIAGGFFTNWAIREAQDFGHLMQRTDSLEKTLILGRIEGRRRRGQQRMRWLNGIIDPIWIIEKAREFQKNIYICFIGYARVHLLLKSTINHKVHSLRAIAGI